MNSPLWFLLAIAIGLVGGSWAMEAKLQEKAERTFECQLDHDSTPAHAKFTCKETRAGRKPVKLQKGT